MVPARLINVTNANHHISLDRPSKEPLYNEKNLLIIIKKPGEIAGLYRFIIALFLKNQLTNNPAQKNRYFICTDVLLISDFII